MSRNRSVLFRCDGSPDIGLGHVIRCLALADELRDRYGLCVAFAVRQGPLAVTLLQDAGYVVCRPPVSGSQDEEAQWLPAVMGACGAGALVLDAHHQVPLAAVRAVREQGALVVTVDDPSDCRLAAHLAFYPPVPQVQSMDWTGFRGQLYVGWEWVVLRRAFASERPHVPHERPMVLVTMGGSDPAGLTLTAVEALDLLDDPFDTLVVLGPGFSHHGALAALLSRARRHFTVCRDVRAMSALMARADLAVASFGVTAYELAASRVPGIYLCLTDDHAASASAIADAGIGISLGLHLTVTPQALAQAVRALLANEAQRTSMATQARALLDGLGAQRIAARIAVQLSAGYD